MTHAPPIFAFFGPGPAGLSLAARRPSEPIAIFVSDWADLDATRRAIGLAGQNARIKVHHVDAATPAVLARFSRIHAAA
jgi:hypothetical protein